MHGPAPPVARGVLSDLLLDVGHLAVAQLERRLGSLARHGIQLSVAAPPPRKTDPESVVRVLGWDFRLPGASWPHAAHQPRVTLPPPRLLHPTSKRSPAHSWGSRR